MLGMILSLVIVAKWFVPFVPSLPSSTSLVTAAHSPVVIVSVAVVLLAVANVTQHG